MRRWTVVVATGLALLAAGCGPDGQDSAESRSAVLPAADVGGKVAGRGTDLLVPASPCGGDGSAQWNGASRGDVVQYDRERDGHDESVTLGSWPMSEQAARTAMSEIEVYRSARGCNTAQYRLNGVSLDLGSSAFRVGIPAGEGTEATGSSGDQPVNRLRGYTWASGRMITVWLEQRGESSPSEADLRRLLEKQSALAEENAAASE